MSTQTQAPAARTSRAAFVTSIILMAVGWLALLAGTGQPLLATIQVDAIGVGALLTAIIVRLRA